jgi:thiol:disulfide interchange protein
VLRRLFMKKRKITVLSSFCLFVIGISLMFLLPSTVLAKSEGKVVNVKLTTALKLLKQKKRKITYVLYASRYCIHCQKMKKIYRQAIAKHPNKEIFKVDLANEPNSSYKKLKGLHVNAIPTLIKYNGTHEVTRLVGESKISVVDKFLQ